MNESTVRDAIRVNIASDICPALGIDPLMFVSELRQALKIWQRIKVLSIEEHPKTDQPIVWDGQGGGWLYAHDLLTWLEQEN